MKNMTAKDVSALVERIKAHLVAEGEHESWGRFVDSQELGDCQGIVAEIVRVFPVARKVCANISVDEPYIDEDGDEQVEMGHHWVEIGGVAYDFAKGTLKVHVMHLDQYEPLAYEGYLPKGGGMEFRR